MQKKVIDRICLVCGQEYGLPCNAEPACTFDPTPQELYADNCRLRARVEELEAALHRAQWALRQPADDWKSHCERRALDQIREVLSCQEENK